MFRSYTTLLRLCLGRKLLWAMAACALLVLCELAQLLLSSYGAAGQTEILGIDLPPLVLAAEAIGRSAAPWLIVPFVACSYAEDRLASGYAALMQADGGDDRLLALRFLLVAASLSWFFAVMMCLFILSVCTIFCRGTFSYEYMLGLANSGIRVLTEHAAMHYSIALLVGTLRVLALGVVSMGVALITRLRYAGVLAVPLVWLALSYTPAMAIALGLFEAIGLSLEYVTMPAYSLMAFTDAADTFLSFAMHEICCCLAAIAISLSMSVVAPRSLRVRSIGASKGSVRRVGDDNG